MADLRSGLDPKDYKYLQRGPDPGFSPERNKAIIAETIRDAENYHFKMRSILDTDGENRVDVLSTYARYRFNVGTKTLREYLGREQYEKLIGENILSKARVAESVNILNKNNKFKKGILI